MSTLEGAVPLGLGITKLRLWDELHRAHCGSMHPTSHSSSSTPTQDDCHSNSATTSASSQIDLNDSSSSTALHRGTNLDSAPTAAKKRRIEQTECLPQVSLLSSAIPTQLEQGQTGYIELQAPNSAYYLSNHRGASSSTYDDATSTSSNLVEPARDIQGVLMPPPQTLPGPSRRKPPPLVSRIKAKARRAKRKQQKAEHRRRLFLAHLVQVTREARRRSPRAVVGSASSSEVATSGSVAAPDSAVKITKTSTAQQAIQQAWLLFPECLGVDLGSFVEIVFDTDAQSSEITAPSDISDDDLAKATRIEIENRQRLGGADVQVPKGVFRWMVARDFAERWPQKMQHVRDNPWPGLEHLWGSPSGSATLEGKAEDGPGTKGKGRNGKDKAEPIRWQSGPRSRFIRKKEKKAFEKQNVQEEIAEVERPDASTSMKQIAGASSSRRPATLGHMATVTGQGSANELAYLEARQPCRQAKELAVSHSALPISARAFEVESAQPSASSKQRPDPFAHPPLTFDTATGLWTWTSVNSCSHAVTVRRSASGVPIRL